MAALCELRHWLWWFAPVTVPTFLLLTFPFQGALSELSFWMLFAGIVVVAVHGAGGILENWRTPRQAVRSGALLFAAITVECLLIRRD